MDIAYTDYKIYILFINQTYIACSSLTILSWSQTRMVHLKIDYKDINMAIKMTRNGIDAAKV